MPNTSSILLGGLNTMHSNEKEKDLNRLIKCMLPGEKTTRDTKPGCYMWNSLQTPISMWAIPIRFHQHELFFKLTCAIIKHDKFLINLTRPQ